jgi:hypothetical protein
MMRRFRACRQIMPVAKTVYAFTILFLERSYATNVDARPLDCFRAFRNRAPPELVYLLTSLRRQWPFYSLSSEPADTPMMKASISG